MNNHAHTPGKSTRATRLHIFTGGHLTFRNLIVE